MTINKNDLYYSKIVRKVISFKHKNKDFIYESLGPANSAPDLNRYAILEGVKKDEIKEFKVKIIHFDGDVEQHFSTWFPKPDLVELNSEKEKRIVGKVAKDVKKDLAKEKNLTVNHSKSKAQLNSSLNKKKSI